MKQGLSFGAEIRERLLDLIKDFVCFAAILLSIWLIDKLHALLWGPGQLVFFRETSYPIKGQWLLDAADLGNLGFFSCRTIWLFARGVFR